MNDDLTDEQRARALDLHRLYHRTLAGVESAVTDAGKQLPSEAKAWLEVEEFILQRHTCEPVWRPVPFAEIQSGWVIRSRSDDGFEMKWGVTNDQDEGGDWFTEAGSRLTCQRFGWTYETTAPEPEPDPRVGLFEGVCLREGVVLTRSDAALLLSIADAAAPTNP